MTRVRTVGIIGAGLSGLTCARELQAGGLQVTVLEKSRGVGGRVATRRTETGVTFDHGAQYFTARDAVFVDEVQHWLETGTAAVWTGHIVTLSAGGIAELHEPRNRYVGVPGMNAIARELATGLNVQLNVTVESVQRSDDGWSVQAGAGGQQGPFDLLICTAPPEQTARLVGGRSPLLDGALARVRMAPCWAVMVQFRAPLPVTYDGAFVHDSPLSWIARNSSKPGRVGGECWVLHASAAWSAEHLEEPTGEIAARLVDEFWRVTQQAPQTREFETAHRWRYAIPPDPMADRSVFDRSRGLGVAGDWCGGPRVEGAYLSGRALALAVLAAS